MKSLQIFDFKDYKTYLTRSLEKRAELERGQRSKLAQFINCQPAYLSLILNGSTHLSPEQAQATNEFLAHTEAESRYFLNLVLLERSGTKTLRDYYLREIEKIKAERAQFKNRIEANRELTEKEQARYYSSWYFAAIHVAASLKHIQTKEQITSALGLPAKTVSEVLEFLTQIGVLKKTGNQYRQGEVSLFIDKQSPFINKHHSNWRVKAIQSLDQVAEKDFHYSGVITCSEEDKVLIKEILMQAVQEIRTLVKNTNKEEVVSVYTMDFYGLMGEV